MQCVKFYSVFISSLMQAVLLLVKQALNLFHNLSDARTEANLRKTSDTCSVHVQQSKVFVSDR